MRARQRHFNPRSAGANLVLDSRYIQQNNDTAINNWSDRSGNGNNASQATAANQPRFRTNIQGGNPTVRFDGSNDFLSIADSNSLDASVWISMHIGYSMRSSSSVGTLAVKRLNDFSSSYNYGIYSSSLTTTPVWGVHSTDAYATLNNLEVIGTHYIFNYQYKKNSFSSYRNGLLQTTSSIVNGNVDLIPNNAALQIGNGPQVGNPNIWPAAVDINYLYVLTSEINSSLRRRLEQAAAYSFKIACS